MFFSQIRLLLWKNFVLHMRSPTMTFAECLLPTLFAFVILGLKFESSKETKPDQMYQRHPAMANFTSSEFGFVPVTPATSDVMQEVIDLHCQWSCLQGRPSVRGFNNNVVAVQYFKENPVKMNYVVKFLNVSSASEVLPSNVKYVIQPYRKVNQIWHTEEMFKFDILPGPRPDALDHEMAYFQTLMGKAVINHWLRRSNVSNNALNISFWFLRYPSLSYNEDTMFIKLKINLTLFLVLGFMLISFVDTKNIVQEKEYKIKESMKLMGMGLMSYWISWFITCFVFLLPALAIYTVILGLKISSKGPVLDKSDPSVVFVILLCYCLALIAFTFLITTLVQKGNEGALAAGLLFLLSYVPYEVMYQKYQDLTITEKYLSCLSFNIAMGFANFHILRLEALGEGVQWSNVNREYFPDLTILDCIVMMLVDTVLYLLVTWYLDNVYPGDFGLAKPHFFFLRKSYWFGPSHHKRHTGEKKQRSLDTDPRYFERDPVGFKAGINIKNLKKDFGKKVSVAGITMKIYEGQITVLLGHNGAGKTTTLSILTGFLAPTSGTASISGHDILTNIGRVRESLGLCPQHDVLFDAMTPREHLWFFAKLKGYKSPNLHGEIKVLLSQLGMGAKGSYLVSKLSGGEKRSLSVGIALMGDSKVVILDEPSSGMDPSTRRLTWDVLKKFRTGRTILLSTHYMDEADALGDRIAIMADGAVQCWGTSMYLKKLYGTGYHLVIVKGEECDVKVLTELITANVPESRMESNTNTEVSYLLPETQCHRFPDLFRHLGDQKKELNIQGFGTTATTMEEVFLRSELFCHSYQTKNSETSDVISSFSLWSHAGGEVDVNELNRDITLVRGMRLWFSQFHALFIKRLLVAWRHWPTTLVTYTCPAIVLLFYIYIDSSIVRWTGRVEPQLFFNLDHYKRTTVVLSGESGTDGYLDYYYDVLEDLQGKHEINETDFTTITALNEDLLQQKKELGKYTFSTKFIVGAIFSNSGGDEVTAMYNGEPYHALFVSIDLALNAIIRRVLGPSYKLTTGVHPLPKKGDSELINIIMDSHQSGFFVGLFVGIGMSMYSSMIVHFLLRERNSGVKHMQAINGVSMLMYWLPNFVWDTLSFVVPTIILFVILSAFDKREFLDDGNWLTVILVIVAFVWAVLPCAYAIHFLFQQPSSGLVGVVILNLFTLLLSDMMVFSLKKPTAGADQENLGTIFDWIFSAFIPAFNLSQCFGFILRNYKTRMACQPMLEECKKGVESLCCIHHPDICHSPGSPVKCFQWSADNVQWDKGKGIGTYLIFMCVQGVIGCLFVFALEYRLLPKLLLLCERLRSTKVHQEPVESVDEDDVIKERELLLRKTSQELSEDKSLLIHNLHKQYGHILAVDHICVAVSEKECFGLLGQSGAGKTTTLRMLTGETSVTSGNAFLMGHDVRTKLRTVQASIGYCPQHDAHIGEMTGKETLVMYARLRGVPSKDIDHLVDGLLRLCLLESYADRLCGKYSGGNRRKLSLAMALVGDPPFLLLDEPSCGMDPKARRQMWNVLSAIRAAGRTLVITSHNMEECDALCTRLAVMLNGRFMCIGSPQHLKNKYGEGYTLIVKMKPDSNGDSLPTVPVLKFMKNAIPETVLFDEHQGYIHLHVPRAQTSLADVFSLMETCKTTLQVEDYSVHETTLEQIFLAFTKRQGCEEDNVESCWFLQAGFFADNFCW